MINTTFRETNLYQMVLHRPVELAGVIGYWLSSGTPLSDSRLILFFDLARSSGQPEA
jgi:hypothetical protein